jgi:ABC-2 type transport system permease protein
MFVIMTILGPLLLAVFTIVTGLLLNIKTGGATRIAVIDQTAGTKLYKTFQNSLLKQVRWGEKEGKPNIAESVNSNAKERMQKTASSLTGTFTVEPVNLNGRSLEEVSRTLNDRIGRGELDGYLVIPPDILQGGASTVSYYGRNVTDVFTNGQIAQRLNQAVTRQRLVENGVSEERIEKLSKPVTLEPYPVSEKGVTGAKDSGAGFAAVFIMALLIYITSLLYGQVVLGAIIEEKETRIAEILFSSARSFTLMFGKLIGVSLVALTQLGIWVTAFLLLAGAGVGWLASQGLEDINIPHLSPGFFVLFFLFFVLGYFIYSTIYALLGSMVTTAQEGAQLAMPIIFLLVSGLYLSFPVMRSPDSPFAVWVSMVPFFSPITMMVRIISKTPPAWQIGLSIFIGSATVVALLWLTARVYRVGMLMYGKKATIPEVWRWVRQA